MSTIYTRTLYVYLLCINRQPFHFFFLLFFFALSRTLLLLLLSYFIIFICFLTFEQSGIFGGCTRRSLPLILGELTAHPINRECVSPSAEHLLFAFIFAFILPKLTNKAFCFVGNSLNRERLCFFLLIQRLSKIHCQQKSSIFHGIMLWKHKWFDAHETHFSFSASARMDM